MTTLPNNNQSRMFRAIVLMGSSLALSCGGKSGQDGDPSSGAGVGGTSSGGAPHGGSFAGGAGGATSGASSSGTLGIAGSSAGGASAAAGSGGAPNCPPAQWSCATSDCTYNAGWQMADCKCDSSKPKLSSDCKSGQAFVCLSMGSPASDQASGFDCRCVLSAASCSQECGAAYPDMRGGFNLSCDDRMAGTILCGCAVVVLK